MIVQEEDNDINISGQSKYPSPMELREQHTLGSTETTSQDPPTGSNILQIARPQTPLEMSRITQRMLSPPRQQTQKLICQTEQYGAALVREDEEEDAYDKARRKCGLDLLPIQRSLCLHLLSSPETTADDCVWIQSTLQERMKLINDLKKSRANMV